MIFLWGSFGQRLHFLAKLWFQFHEVWRSFDQILIWFSLFVAPRICRKFWPLGSSHLVKEVPTPRKFRHFFGSSDLSWDLVCFQFVHWNSSTVISSITPRVSMNAVRGFRVGLLLLGRSQWEFHEEFHDIKYHQFCWHDNEREEWSFMGGCEENFITWNSSGTLT